MIDLVLVIPHGLGNAQGKVGIVDGCFFIKHLLSVYSMLRDAKMNESLFTGFTVLRTFYWTDVVILLQYLWFTD